MPAVAATAANLTTVRLSSGISANILDFGIPQKHVLSGMTAMDTGGRPLTRLPVQAKFSHFNGAKTSGALRANPGESPCRSTHRPNRP